MRIRTTSTQRTYRYVRLGIVGAMLLLGVSVVAHLATGARLPSLSASYYTPVGPMFVGSLCAVALALVALSGRSVEQALLDIAALFALVVAVVPTTVEGPPCPGVGRCVPVAVVPTVVNNGVAVASVVLLGIIAAVVLALTQGTAGRGVAVTVAAAATVLVGFVVWALLDFSGFLRAAHNTAAIGFFAIVGIVAAVAAWRPQRSPRGFRTAYGVIAAGVLLSLAGLFASLVGAAAGTGDPGGVPWVFVGESVALALFAVFWIVQTAELWNDVDPAVRA